MFSTDEVGGVPTQESRVKWRLMRLGVLALSVFAACTAVGSSETGDSGTAPSDSDRALEAPSSTTPGYAVLEAPMTKLQGFVEDWNEGRSRWVGAVMDPDTSPQELIEIQSEVAQSQAAVVAGMRLTVEEMPAELQDPFWPIVENYEERFRVLQTIFQAVVQGDETTFEQAGARYYELSSPEVMIQLLDEVFNHPALSDLFAAEGTDPSSLVEAFRAAFGVPLAESPSTEAEGDWYLSLMEERFVADALRFLDDTIYVDLSKDLLLSTGWRYCEFRATEEPTTAAADAVALLVVYGVDVPSTRGSLEGDAKTLAAVVILQAEQYLCQEYHEAVRQSRPGSIGDASDPAWDSVAAYLVGADGPVPGSVGDTDRLRAPSTGEWIYLDSLERAEDWTHPPATATDQDRWLQGGYMFCVIADHLGPSDATQILSISDIGDSIVPVAFWSAHFLCPDHYEALLGAG